MCGEKPGNIGFLQKDNENFFVNAVFFHILPNGRTFIYFYFFKGGRIFFRGFTSYLFFHLQNVLILSNKAWSVQEVSYIQFHFHKKSLSKALK